MTHAEPIKIGTRGSPLALKQAHAVSDALADASGGAITGEIVTFKTSGDQLTTERLINSGGKGLFTKEIDRAVDDGRVDIAVHSLKDVPSLLPDGQVFVAFLPREDPREAFISRVCDHPRDLPNGATVGTASLRREAQTLAMRPDLNIVTFRGLVETRLNKLDAGEADATYLALAGLKRLGLAHHGTPIPLEDMLPSPAQGIIGVAAKDGALSDTALAALNAISDTAATAAATAERAFLKALDGSCRTPIAGHLLRDRDGWRLVGEVLDVDGSRRWRAEGRVSSGASASDFETLGTTVGNAIRADAGDDLPAFEDG